MFIHGFNGHFMSFLPFILLITLLFILWCLNLIYHYHGRTRPEPECDTLGGLSCFWGEF